MAEESLAELRAAFRAWRKRKKHAREAAPAELIDRARAAKRRFGAAAVFVLVLVSQKASHDVLGLTAAALIAGPGLFALAAPKQDVIEDAVFVATMQRIWREFKSTFLHWGAIPYTLLMLFPIGSGAAIGLLPGVARDYGVNGDHVAWVIGLGGALLMAAGSLAATTIPARIRASVGYLTVALINAGASYLGPCF